MLSGESVVNCMNICELLYPSRVPHVRYVRLRLAFSVKVMSINESASQKVGEISLC